MQLDKYQQSIIDDRNHSQLVLAAAGTGKTLVICGLIDRLCRDGIPSEQILCLTFTTKACNEMNSRVISKDIEIKTIYGLFYRLMSKFAICVGFTSNDISIAPETYMQELCKKIMIGMHATSFSQIEAYKFVQKVIARASGGVGLEDSCRIEILSKNMIKKATDKAFARWRDWLMLNGLNFVQAVLEESAAYGMVDFSQLLYYASVLADYQEVLDEVRTKRYLIIDEVQDTSKAEFDVLSRLWNNNSNTIISLFGDVNQAIYEWRGSDPEYIIDTFMNRYSPKQKDLIINYRSDFDISYISQCLLDNWNNTKLSNLMLDAAKNVGLTEPHPLTVLIAGKNYYKAVIQVIQKWRSGGGHERYAVLARTNKELAELRNLCQAVGSSDVSFGLTSDYNMGDTFQFRILKELLFLSAFKMDEYAAIRLLSCTGNDVSKAYYCLELLDNRYNVHNEGYYDALFNAIRANKLIVLDLETTGKDIYSARMIQIAMLNPLTGEVYDTLIKSDTMVGESQWVHGYTDEQLATEGRDLSEVLSEVLEMLNGCVIVGHNIWYDLNILSEEVERCGMSNTEGAKWLNSARVYDTLHESRKWLANRKLANYKLDTIRSFFGIKFKATHNAIDDIKATSQVLLKILKHFIVPSRDEDYQGLLAYYQDKRGLISILQGLLSEGENVPGLIHKCFTLFQVTNSGLVSEQLADEEVKVLDIYNELQDFGLTKGCKAICLYNTISMKRSEMESLMHEQGKIPAITIHQSKGCEFDKVVLIDAKERGYDIITREGIHVLYVGMTRAKNELVIVSKASNVDEISDELSCIPKECLRFIDFGGE